MTSLLPYRHPVTFGDCDPAGIVFYPNIFRWMDAAFHATLYRIGGHREICGRLGAIGLGLMDATCAFRAPLRPGDAVELCPTVTDWGRKSLTVAYEGRLSGKIAFTGREVRGIFRDGPEGLSTGDVADLRAIFAEAGFA